MFIQKSKNKINNKQIMYKKAVTDYHSTYVKLPYQAVVFWEWVYDPAGY